MSGGPKISELKNYLECLELLGERANDVAQMSYSLRKNHERYKDLQQLLGPAEFIEKALTEAKSSEKKLRHILEKHRFNLETFNSQLSLFFQELSYDFKSCMETGRSFHRETGLPISGIERDKPADWNFASPDSQLISSALTSACEVMTEIQRQTAQAEEKLQGSEKKLRDLGVLSKRFKFQNLDSSHQSLLSNANQLLKYKDTVNLLSCLDSLKQFFDLIENRPRLRFTSAGEREMDQCVGISKDLLMLEERQIMAQTVKLAEGLENVGLMVLIYSHLSEYVAAFERVVDHTNFAEALANTKADSKELFKEIQRAKSTYIPSYYEQMTLAAASASRILESLPPIPQVPPGPPDLEREIVIQQHPSKGQGLNESTKPDSRPLGKKRQDNTGKTSSTDIGSIDSTSGLSTLSTQPVLASQRARSATLLSVLFGALGIWGLGQIYAGRLKRGIGFLLIGLSMSMLAALGAFVSNPILVYSTLSTGFLVWIGQSVDARRCARNSFLTHDEVNYLSLNSTRKNRIAGGFVLLSLALPWGIFIQSSSYDLAWLPVSYISTYSSNTIVNIAQFNPVDAFLSSLSICMAIGSAIIYFGGGSSKAAGGLTIVAASAFLFGSGLYAASVGWIGSPFPYPLGVLLALVGATYALIPST